MDRVIMHIDMNSYFASVEQQANPKLRGKPVGVGGPSDGRTVVAAASVEAKRRGVKSGMSLFEVKRICPDMILVQGDFHKYATTTDRILRIFRRFTPLLEVFSIDEAFLDVTPTMETFENAIRVAYAVKSAIKREVGEWLTCSVGIAPNKLLAKLASDMKKPDGLVVVRKEDIPALLKSIELEDLCGIGSRTRRNLLKIGIDTVEKLGNTPVEILAKRFGKLGFWLHDMGNGIDESPVMPYYEIPEPKSMGHSYTLPKDTADAGEIFSTLLRLSEQVGRRLRAEKFRGRIVHAGIASSDFIHFGKQRALKKWTDDGFEIYKVAREIIEGFEYYGKIRHIRVSISELSKGAHQLSFLPEILKKERLVKAMDHINNKYGEFTVGRASLMLTRLTRGPSGLGVNRAMARSHRNEVNRLG
ncbi:MAG: DNA polymerase IV [Vulcanimicrobiota bacterium]